MKMRLAALMLTTALTTALAGSLAASPVAAQTASRTASAAPSSQASSAAPSLIVTIVVDQLSANLFNQYRGQFTGGLKTLADQGMIHINGYQTHGITTTCPGHSTILTGKHPTHTGIPANDWIDTATGQEVYCLAAPQNTLAHGRNTDNGPVGPDQLLATTLGDWLKAEHPESRVYGVSGKDRGAINLAGHQGDGAFWLTDNFGFTTYVEPGQQAADRLAPVTAINARFIERFTQTPPSWTFEHEQCRRLAGDWTIGAQSFHSTVPPEDFRLDNSPILDELTLEGAIELLQTQQLGRRGVTDMLGVSLSGTDRIGHGFGTQGPEMCEQILRMDRALGVFLDAVAQTPGGALVVLTADHGGSDFPERMHDRGSAEAGRNDPTLLPRINEVLKAQFNLTANPIVSGGTGFIVVDKDKRSLPEPLRTEVMNAAIALLNAEPTVYMAESRDVLLAEPMPTEVNPETLTVRERLRLSAAEGRGADIMRAFAWGLTGSGRVGGTISSHGSPWDYDRRVPIIFWRTGGEGQERFWPIRTIDIAPTLANVIGVKAPGDLDGRCVDLEGFSAPSCSTAARP